MKSEFRRSSQILIPLTPADFRLRLSSINVNLKVTLFCIELQQFLS